MSRIPCGSHFLSSLGLVVLECFGYVSVLELSHWRMGFLRMDQILNSFGDIVVNACDSLRLHEECDLLSLRIDKASRFGVLGRKRVRAFLVNCLNLDWFIFGEVTEMTLKCFVSFVESWPCYRCCSVAGHAMATMEWGLWGPSAAVLLQVTQGPVWSSGSQAMPQQSCSDAM